MLQFEVDDAGIKEMQMIGEASKNPKVCGKPPLDRIGEVNAAETKHMLAGRTFGRWTVEDEVQLTKKGERKWLCRCSCGNERFVLERSLRSGGSLSCGCLRRERLAEAISSDLSGRQFGELRVIERAGAAPSSRGVRWLCRCSCGQEIVVAATLLNCGRKTHCGCKSKPQYAYSDIRDRRFGMLTAEEPTEKRDSSGHIIWLCRCDCGNVAEVSYKALVYGQQISCGCRKLRHNEALGGLLARVDGTSLDMLKSAKVPVNNTTGVKGVYLIKGRYLAKIVFQRRQYELGWYANMEDAAQARHAAEEMLRADILPYYEVWKGAAGRDPQWAEAHPMRVAIRRDAAGKLYVELTPDIREIPQYAETPIQNQ